MQSQKEIGCFLDITIFFNTHCECGAGCFFNEGVCFDMQSSNKESCFVKDAICFNTPIEFERGCFLCCSIGFNIRNENSKCCYNYDTICFNSLNRPEPTPEPTDAFGNLHFHQA